MAFPPFNEIYFAGAESYMIERGVENMKGAKRTSCILHLVEMNIALHLNSSFSWPFLNEDETCWEFCQLLDPQPYIFRLL